ncbi:MAG: beta galactosidase jelly roll domain-containing protein, partial [Acholeplasmataceae bacterium]|nr:beta galactosidase jelly roll domain-containing protein [Acholeplasmataceae bacterium]
MKHVKAYIENYPRPQFVRSSWKSLDGTWAFAFDDQDLGLSENWHLGFESNLEIKVPFSYQTKDSGIHQEEQHEVVWYKRSFEHHDQRNVLLHFEGSDFHTMVWVNGMFIGEERGGYHRFSFDVTNQLKEKNEIIVRVMDTFSTCQPRGKQRWKNESFGCWYVETTGLWKSVWLEYVHETHLKSVQIKSSELMVDLMYFLNKVEQETWLETVISFEDEIVHHSKTKITHLYHKHSIDLKTNMDQFKIKLWSGEHPNLYDVSYRLWQNDHLIDEVKSYFGMRQWKTIKRGIYLNHNPIYLKMLLDQGYWPTSGLTPPSETHILNDIHLTKKMGFNGIRKHQKIEDERFYYYCDLMGIYVWLEMPSFYEYHIES